MALYVAKVSDSFIRHLASKFLDSHGSMKKLAKDYNSSAGTISNILYRGVVDLILSDVTATAVANKAIETTENTYRTRTRWQKALRLREANILEAQLDYMKRKAEELRFKVETYDDFFFDDEFAPSKDSLDFELYNLNEEIKNMTEQIEKLRG